ncbi:MAG TPA: efflux RND transporter periplasmic adaptor subunit [Terracidiphilus sp.]|nr:efflux RND transporter periplasmic adaptor subunit [Terracidiphilus sp.]
MLTEQRHNSNEQDQPPAAPRKRRFWLAALLALAICVALALPLLHKQAVAVGPGGPPGAGGGMKAGSSSAVSVTAAKVESGQMNVYLDALGTVTPLQTVNVYSQASGVLLAVHYREGQIVHKGELLAEIDPRPLQAQLKQAQGNLARDRATLQQAKLNLKRYQDALKENAIAEQTVSDQEATVQQDEGTVQNDEGTVEYDEVQLGYTRIVAPINGRIGLRLVDPGNTIFSGSSSTIATITQLDPITVVFSVAEDHLGQIQKQLNKRSDLQVDLYDRAQTSKLTTGQLLSLDNQVDTSTGTVRLRAQFSNAKNELFPNQFVNARLVVDKLDQARLIPTVAIQYNGQQAFVYVVKANNTVAIQNVSVLGSEQSRSAIDGLNVGDTVVTSNFDRLQDGATVAQSGAGSAAGLPGPRS